MNEKAFWKGFIKAAEVLPEYEFTPYYQPFLGQNNQRTPLQQFLFSLFGDKILPQPTQGSILDAMYSRDMDTQNVQGANLALGRSPIIQRMGGVNTTSKLFPTVSGAANTIGASKYLSPFNGGDVTKAQTNLNKGLRGLTMTSFKN